MAKILLVDDDPLVRSIVAQMIEAGGHEVLIGRQGRQAVADVREQSFDLLITDVVMPEVCGWELIAILRDVKPQTPALVISGGGLGFSAGFALDVGLRLGADAAPAKPFELDRLLELIEATLER